MANISSVAHLYSSVTQLAFTEQQTANQPNLPFSHADGPALVKQSNDVANCALRLRQRSPGPISQTGVFTAQALVDSAQTMLITINQQMSAGIWTKQQVFAAVSSAVVAVDAL